MKIIYPSLTCYLPENFNVSLIPCYNKRWHEKYVYFIHTLLFRSLRGGESFNGYVNMSSKIIQHLLGSHYSKYIITQLINAKIIEVNKSYSQGSFSKSYRITEKFTNGIKIKTEVIKKQTYCRKIAITREAILQDLFSKNPLLRHEYLMLSDRRIKVTEAITYINGAYEEASPEWKSRAIAIRQFDSMKNKEESFPFSYNKGRVYSPCSNLPTDLEQFTYFVGYENEKSIQVDMPNSQLCFFHELVKRKMHNIGDEEREGGNFPHLVKKSVSSPIAPYVMHFNKPWEEYIFKGKGYEVMMSLTCWRGKSEGHTPEERQSFKAEFFGQLFYNKYNDKFTPMEQVFYWNFESEAKALRDLKRHLGNKLLAIQVQGLEGDFFHNTIVSYMLQNRYFDIPFTIKHDSITLPESQASYLIAELNNLVHEFFGRKDINFKFAEL